MYQLYSVMKVFGKIQLDLCENYEEESIMDIREQVVAMWPENDRPVTMILMDEDGNVLVTFVPLTNGVNVIEGTQSDLYTTIEYVYDNGEIVASEMTHNGERKVIQHNW